MYRIIGGDRQEYGPATAEELREWIAEGRLNADSFARNEPEGQWQPLSKFPEFAEALSEQGRVYGQSPASAPLPPRTRRDLNVSECLVKAWQLWLSNFGLFCAASVLVWIASMALQFLPILGLFYWLIRGALFGGLFILVLRRLRGQEASVGDAFSGFGPGAMQLMLVGMTVSILTWFGFMLCVLPGVYFTIAWALSLPAAADQRLDFWSAMERSRKAVAGQWSRMFVLVLIAFLPAILTTLYAELKIAAVMYEALKPFLPQSGFPDFQTLFKEMNRVAADVAKTGMPLILATKVALLFNLPFGISAIAMAYEELIGKPSRSKD